MANTGAHWSDGEIDLIVAAYFDMLKLELDGKSYVKAEYRAELEKLTGRSKGSIELKHQNISAVLLELGMPRIRGYSPMAHYQAALLEGIERYLEKNPMVLQPAQEKAVAHLGVAESASLYLEAPPSLEPTGEPEAKLERLLRKFDPAARDERNRALGKAGEEQVFLSERARLIREGKSRLADRVRWVSQEDGDGAGYDIHSFEIDGRDRLLEVKTTTGYQLTPFYISENERRLSVEQPDAFRLVRVYDFIRAPRAFEIVPPLEKFVRLHPVTHRASFRLASA